MAMAEATGTGDPATEARERTAKRECQKNLRWYRFHGLLALFCYRSLQTTAIVLSALTAVLVLATDLPKWVQALPAAFGALAVSLSAVYQWREDCVRWLATAQVLRSELHDYDTCHPELYSRKLSADERLDRFVVRTQQIVRDETRQWQNMALSDSAGRRHRRAYTKPATGT